MEKDKPKAQKSLMAALGKSMGILNEPLPAKNSATKKYKKKVRFE